MRAAAIAVITMVAVHAAPARADLRFHFEDDFTGTERTKLTAWIDEVADGVESLVGPYPFDVHIRFVRTHSGGPVPWANTLRGRSQGVRFYVDPGHSPEALRADWTAPHELSHLILPYVGRHSGWFAEGFASFMQYQVMHAMGVLSDGAVSQRYLERLGKAKRGYAYPDRPFADAAPRLRAERKYPTMYWGGAVFFLRLNQTLQQETDGDLLVVLADYLRCCRRNRATLEALVSQLDDLAGASYFSDELAAFRSTPGFPDFENVEPGAIRTVRSAE